MDFMDLSKYVTISLTTETTMKRRSTRITHIDKSYENWFAVCYETPK